MDRVVEIEKCRDELLTLKQRLSEHQPREMSLQLCKDELLINFHNIQCLVNALGSLGYRELAKKTQEVKKKEEYLLKSIELAEQSENKKAASESAFEYGSYSKDIAKQCTNKEESIQNYEKALRHFTNVSSKSEKYSASMKCASICAEKLRRYKTSLMFLNKYAKCLPDNDNNQNAAKAQQFVKETKLRVEIKQVLNEICRKVVKESV
jgi:hypothetical protein